MKRTTTALLCFAAATAMGAAVSTGSVAALATTTAQDENDPAILRDYLSGNGLLNRGLYDLAAEEYRKFLAAHPGHSKAPVARYGLAVALYRMDKVDEAAAEFATLFDEVEFEYAAEVAFLLGQIRMSRGEFENAAAAFERVMRTQARHELADDATALLLEALYRADHFDAMSEPFRILGEEYASSPLRERGELFWGLSEMSRQRYAEAADHFDRMLERAGESGLAPRIRLLLAKSLHQAEDFDAAAERYREVIEEGDEELAPDAFFGLATIVRRDGDAAEAAVLLDRFFELANEHESAPTAHFERGRVYYDLGEFEKAGPQFAAAADADDSLRDGAAYWQAKTELRLERYSEAAARLTDAIASFPESPLLAEMHYDRAVALHKAEKPSEAIDALREFRSAFPSHEMAPEALHTIVVTLHQQQNYAKSAAECRRFLEENPQHALRPQMLFLLGENLYLAGEHEPAVSAFEEFLEEYPSDPQRQSTRFRLGMALERLGRHDDAEKHLAEIVSGSETEEPFRAALLVLGDLAFERRDWAAAAARMQEYLSIEGNLPDADDALIKLGLAQHRGNDLEGALRNYARLIDEHGESPHATQARFERGQALVALGRDDEAAAAFAAVLADQGAERFVPFTLSHLGALAMKADDHETAIDYYQQLREVTTDPAVQAEAIFQQGQALMAIGRYEDAAAAFAEVSGAQTDSPRIPLARANRALSLAKTGAAEATLQAIDDALSQSGENLEDPLRASLLYERAWAHRALQQADEAQKAYRELMSRHGDHVLGRYARLELGEMLADADQYDSAAELLEPLQQLREDDPADIHERATYRLGICRYEQERYEEAAVAFDACMARAPNTSFAASLHLLAGESLFRLDRHAAAREHLELALAASDEAALRGPGLLRLGETLASLQEWPASEKVFLQYLDEFEDSELRYQAEFGLAFALENQQQYDRAIEAYTSIVDHHQGPTAARSQFQIGECLFAQGRHQEAVRELLKVDILYAYPEWSAAALFEAGRCFEALAETGQARNQFEQVRRRFAETRWAELAGQRLAALAAQSPPGRSR